MKSKITQLNQLFHNFLFFNISELYFLADYTKDETNLE